MIITSPPCLGCGDVAQFSISTNQHDQLLDGAHVQDIFPDWSPEDRERLISGTCPSCWEEMWAEEEEEEWTDEDLDDLFEPYGYSLLDPESDLPEYSSDYYVDQDCD